MVVCASASPALVCHQNLIAQAVSWMLFANSTFPGFWHALCCQSYWLKPLVDFKTSSPCIVTDLLKMDFFSLPDLHFSVGRADAKQVVLRFQIEAVSSYCGNKWWHYNFFCFLVSLHFYLSKKISLYLSPCMANSSKLYLLLLIKEYLAGITVQGFDYLRHDVRKTRKCTAKKKICCVYF